jgi:hypothetical protein
MCRGVTVHHVGVTERFFNIMKQIVRREVDADIVFLDERSRSGPSRGLCGDTSGKVGSPRADLKHARSARNCRMASSRRSSDVNEEQFSAFRSIDTIASLASV